MVEIECDFSFFVKSLSLFVISPAQGASYIWEVLFYPIDKAVLVEDVSKFLTWQNKDPVLWRVRHQTYRAALVVILMVNVEFFKLVVTMEASGE